MRSKQASVLAVAILAMVTAAVAAQSVVWQGTLRVGATDAGILGYLSAAGPGGGAIGSLEPRRFTFRGVEHEVWGVYYLLLEDAPDGLAIGFPEPLGDDGHGDFARSVEAALVIDGDRFDFEHATYIDFTEGSDPLHIYWWAFESEYYTGPAWDREWRDGQTVALELVSTTTETPALPLAGLAALAALLVAAGMRGAGRVGRG